MHERLDWFETCLICEKGILIEHDTTALRRRLGMTQEVEKVVGKPSLLIAENIILEVRLAKVFNHSTSLIPIVTLSTILFPSCLHFLMHMCN